MGKDEEKEGTEAKFEAIITEFSHKLMSNTKPTDPGSSKNSKPDKRQNKIKNPVARHIVLKLQIKDKEKIFKEVREKTPYL